MIIYIYPQTPCVAQTLTLRMSCCRIYDRRDGRKYCVYAVFSSLGFKVSRADRFSGLGFVVWEISKHWPCAGV